MCLPAEWPFWRAVFPEAALRQSNLPMKWLFCRTGVNPAPSSLRNWATRCGSCAKKPRWTARILSPWMPRKFFWKGKGKNASTKSRPCRKWKPSRPNLRASGQRPRSLRLKAMTANRRPNSTDAAGMPLCRPCTLRRCHPRRAPPRFSQGRKQPEWPIWPLPMPIMNLTRSGTICTTWKSESLPCPRLRGFCRILPNH